MRRLSCLMTDAELHAETAVLCGTGNLAPERIAPLFQHQIGFQYLPENVWKECQEEHGILVCRGMRFRAVLGPADRFPGVSHQISAVVPDCGCDPPQPELRAARFTRAGVECWLLVNEGENLIEAELTLPTDGPIGQYDLWNGMAFRFHGRLRLPRRGSLLLFTCGAGEWETLSSESDPVMLPMPAFSLVNEDTRAARKEYRAALTVAGSQLAQPSAVLEVRAEEMAELYVNDRFAGVGFWPPQRFNLMPYLRTGENTLRLVVTGSPANRYGNGPVPYGLL